MMHENLRQEVERIAEERQEQILADKNSIRNPILLNSTESVNVNCEALVYRVVGIYLQRKLSSKYWLEWAAVRMIQAKGKDYKRRREKKLHVKTFWLL